MQSNQLLTQVSDIDWESWRPHNIVTSLFVIDDKKILLIRKKRGIGAGKINAPGGKINPGETIKQCALRELEEEVGLKACNATFCGENLFQFIDGYTIHVHVFITHHYTGIPIETSEAVPLWFNINNIPYDEMWEDNFLWFPHMLSGTIFTGKYLFDSDTMIDAHVQTSK